MSSGPHSGSQRCHIKIQISVFSFVCLSTLNFLSNVAGTPWLPTPPPSGTPLPSSESVWSLQGLAMRHAAGTCRAPMLPRLAAVGAPGNPAQMTCLLPDLDFLQPCSPTTISNVKLLSCCLSSEKQGSTQVSRQGQQSRSLTAYLPSKSRVSATVVKNLQVNSS